jgi:hypothetical protein
LIGSKAVPPFTHKQSKPSSHPLPHHPPHGRRSQTVGKPIGEGAGQGRDGVYFDLAFVYGRIPPQPKSIHFYPIKFRAVVRVENVKVLLAFPFSSPQKIIFLREFLTFSTRNNFFSTRKENFSSRKICFRARKSKFLEGNK